VPFPGNLAAIAAGIAAVVAGMTMGSAGIRGLSSVPGLAQGGVIPAGFPNDTYPALLSSGETVVPPGKLNDLMGGEVVFTIKGDTLVGVLNKSKRKTASYS
jgi:hypothetical protein